MQKPLLTIGALLVAAGLLIASGLMKYNDKEEVVDFGALEIEATQEKKAPLDWGYVLIGIGAVALVAGAMVRRP